MLLIYLTPILNTWKWMDQVFMVCKNCRPYWCIHRLFVLISLMLCHLSNFLNRSLIGALAWSRYSWRMLIHSCPRAISFIHFNFIFSYSRISALQQLNSRASKTSSEVIWSPPVSWTLDPCNVAWTISCWYSRVWATVTGWFAKILIGLIFAAKKWPANPLAF